MSPTMRGLVIPVSDLQGAKAICTALLGAWHTDGSSYVGYDIDGFEVALNPAGHGGRPVTFADVGDPDAIHDTLLAAATTGRDARVRSHQRRGSVCSPTGTAIPSGDTETPHCAWDRTAFNVE